MSVKESIPYLCRGIKWVMLIINMGNQKKKRNLTIAFCIPRVPYGNMWSNEGEFYVVLWHFRENLQWDSLQSLFGQGLSCTSFLAPAIQGSIWNLFSGDRVWEVGIIFSGHWQFPWIWVEKNKYSKMGTVSLSLLIGLNKLCQDSSVEYSQNGESKLQGRGCTY